MSGTSKKVEAYALEPKFERQLARAACGSREFHDRLGKEIEADALQDEVHKLAVKAALDVAKDLGHGPDSSVLVMQKLRAWMNDGRVTLEQLQAVNAMLDEAEDGGGASSAENVIKTLVPILQRRLLGNAVRTSMDEFSNRGDLKRTVELVARANRLGAVDPGYARVTVTALSTITPEPTRWLWAGRVPFGKMTVLDGDPGLGKSTLTIDIVARLTSGRAMPGEEDARVRPPANSVVITFEDGIGDTVLPRLRAAGGDAGRVFVLENFPAAGGSTRLPTLPDDVAAIEDVLKEKQAKLLIVDPLMAALSGRCDSAKDQDVRRALAPLEAMARRLGTAVILIRHLNKNNATPTALYRGGGSIGISGAARSVLLVAKDPADSTARVLASVKSNVAAPPPTLRFRVVPSADLEASRIEWLGESEVSADVALLTRPPEAPEDGSRRFEAREFLKTVLDDGPRTATAVKKEAKEAGIAEKTLIRAKEDLGVRVKKSGLEGCWSWELPAKRNRPAGDGHLGHLGHLQPILPLGPESAEGGQDGQGGHGCAADPVAAPAEPPPALVPDGVGNIRRFPPLKLDGEEETAP